ALVLEEMVEEWELDILAEEFAGQTAEASIAQAVARFPSPAAVPPRAHHQDIEDPLIFPFDGPVNLQRAVQVLGIEPAADSHHRRRHLLQVRQQVVRLPEVIIARSEEHTSELQSR